MGGVYIIDGLLRNDSEVQPETIHADTQGQSLPVFGVAALLGFELLPRIRNWHDLNFYRPMRPPGTSTSTRCSATTPSTGT
nr:transposase [Saccharopolyspora pogona]